MAGSVEAGAIAALIAASMWVPTAGGAVAVRRVALTGDGIGDGKTLGKLETFSLNDAGDVALGATLLGGQPDATGVFIHDGSLRVVAQSGDSAPGGGTFTHLALSYPVINERGEVAFLGHDSTVNDWRNGVYTTANLAGTNPTHEVRKVARHGETPAGMPSEKLGSLYGVLLNDRGESAFLGQVESGPSGIWRTSALTGGVEAVVAWDLPVTDPDAVYPGPTLRSAQSEPSLNHHGQIALGAHYVDGASRYGVFTGNQTPLTVRVSSRAPVPGAPAGSTFKNFATVVSNDAGYVAFRGDWREPGATEDTWGLFIEEGGGVVPVARTGGEDAPGASSPFDSIPAPFITMNTGGDLAFIGRFGPLDGPGDGVYFRPAGGDLRPVAIETEGPLSDDTDFERLFPASIHLNGQGQVVFMAQPHGGTLGLYLTEPDAGSPVLIAAVGEMWDLDGIAGGESREILAFQLPFASSGNEDGRASPLNESGELAFIVRFTDGTSGIYAATIPEPVSLSALALLVPLARRSRRGR